MCQHQNMWNKKRCLRYLQTAFFYYNVNKYFMQQNCNLFELLKCYNKIKKFVKGGVFMSLYEKLTLAISFIGLIISIISFLKK